jgi:hypothetical protein
MKLLYIQKLIYFYCTSLMLLNLSACKQEITEVNPISISKITVLDKAKQWFAKHQLNKSGQKSGSNPLLQAEREPDWADTTLQQHRKADLIEMPLKYDGQQLMAQYRDLRTGIMKTGITKILLRENPDETFSPIIMRIFADSAYLAQVGNQLADVSFKHIPADFSGSIYFFDWSEQYLGINEYLNGILTHSSIGNKNKSDSPDCEAFQAVFVYYVNDTTREPGGYEIGSIVIIVCSSGGSMSGGDDTSGGTGGSNPDEGSSGEPSENPGGGGNSGPGSGLGFDPYCIDCGSTIPDLKLTREPTFKANAKAQCVYDRIAQIPEVKALMADFANLAYGFNVSMALEPLPVGRDGQTVAINSNYSAGQVRITINSNTIAQMSEVELAKNIIHELIHAHILAQIAKVGGMIGLSNLPILNDFYNRTKKLGKYDHGTAQHEYMATAYHETLAQATRAFHQNQYDIAYYRALAWQGLHKTTKYPGNFDEGVKYYLTSIANQIKANSLLNKQCN